jgi:hypothetical protein
LIGLSSFFLSLAIAGLRMESMLEELLASRLKMPDIETVVAKQRQIVLLLLIELVLSII